VTSFGAQENQPPGLSSGDANVPQVVRGPWRPQPKVSWLTHSLFIVVLTFLSVIFIYPFIWLVSASLKPRGETFDNALIPHNWAWNFTGPNLPEPHAQFLFNVAPVAQWLQSHPLQRGDILG